MTTRSAWYPNLAVYLTDQQWFIDAQWEWVLDSLALGPHGQWLERAQLESAWAGLDFDYDNDVLNAAESIRHDSVPESHPYYAAYLQGLIDSIGIGPARVSEALEQRVLQPFWARSSEKIRQELARRKNRQILVNVVAEVAPDLFVLKAAETPDYVRLIDAAQLSNARRGIPSRNAMFDLMNLVLSDEENERILLEVLRSELP